jgi:hypothetical protein
MKWFILVRTPDGEDVPDLALDRVDVFVGVSLALAGAEIGSLPIVVRLHSLSFSNRQIMDTFV